MATSCSICSDDRGPLINTMLAAGRSPGWIEKEMKRLERPTKAETVRRHLSRCLNGQRENTGLLDDAASGRNVMANPDFALAVRKEANKLLAEGKLHVRAEHGLAAQGLLDRRAEKQADRRLMVELAGLMAGVHNPLRAPDELVIEGEWKEVEPPDEDGLAPLALVSSE